MSPVRERLALTHKVIDFDGFVRERRGSAHGGCVPVRRAFLVFVYGLCFSFGKLLEIQRQSDEECVVG